MLLDKNAAVATGKSVHAMFLILSNTEKDAQTALWLYSERDATEKFFDDIKNNLDMDRLHMHSRANAKRRLFLQYFLTILLHL